LSHLKLIDLHERGKQEIFSLYLNIRLWVKAIPQVVNSSATTIYGYLHRSRLGRMSSMCVRWKRNQTEVETCWKPRVESWRI